MHFACLAGLYGIQVEFCLPACILVAGQARVERGRAVGPVASGRATDACEHAWGSAAVVFVVRAASARPSESDMRHQAHETARKALREMKGGNKSMSRIFAKYTQNPKAIDLLEKALEAIVADGYLALDQEFMYGIFWELMEVKRSDVGWNLYEHYFALISY